MSHQTIFRTKLTRDFTTLPNSLLRDSRLSFRARGVLAMILSNTGEWVVTSKWVQSQGPEGREAIKASLDELKSLGYATFEKQNGVGGTFFNRWNFFDIPNDGKPSLGEPNDGKPNAGKPSFGKPDNGKPSSSENYIEEKPVSENNTQKNKERAPKKFKPPTLEEAKAKAVEMGMPEREGEKFFNHFESNGWKVGGRSPMKNWNSAMRTWRLNFEERGGRLRPVKTEQEDDHEKRYGFPRGTIPLSQQPVPGEDEHGNKIGMDEWKRRFPLSLYDHDR